MPTTLLRAPPPILRPSYGPAVSYAWFAISVAVIHTQYEFSRLICLRMINSILQLSQDQLFYRRFMFFATELKQK